MYSRNAPRVEVIQSVPGTLWVPAVGSGIHHIGYWSDDIARDAAGNLAVSEPVTVVVKNVVRLVR